MFVMHPYVCGMNEHTHTRIHTYMHTYTHNTYVYIYIHTQATYMHIHIHAYRWAAEITGHWCGLVWALSCISYIHTYMHTSIRTYIHIHIHACRWAAEITGHRYGLMWALFGISYERALPLHKMTGRLAYATMLVHMAITINKVCVYVCMHVCVYMKLCLCIWSLRPTKYVWYTYICTHTHTRTWSANFLCAQNICQLQESGYAFTDKFRLCCHIYTLTKQVWCMYACLFVCIHIYTYIYIYIYTHEPEVLTFCVHTIMWQLQESGYAFTDKF